MCLTIIYIYIMSKVVEIGISNISGSKIQSFNTIKAIKGSGLENDRHFKESNDKKCQITLIEIENIVNYNKKLSTKILPLEFRRNIITQGIALNNLINKEFFIGAVKVKAHDLCRPCKHLQELLQQKNIVEEFLHKGGLRCEILSSGTININDEIVI